MAIQVCFTNELAIVGAKLEILAWNFSVLHT